MKRYILLLLIATVSLCAAAGGGAKRATAKNKKVVVAYVTSWSQEVPDPTLMTHINYAFAHVNATRDGLRIDNPNRLRSIAKLKKNNKELKVLLSVGGWGSGGFSEMAADTKKREAFAKSCAKTIEDYGIDGIDIDWEYPTSKVAGISSSPDDTRNFTKLMRDIRKAIGNNRLLTMASISSAKYVNFSEVMKYVDFINIMSYDMTASGNPHNSPLYTPSGKTHMSTDKAVTAHRNAGVPASKIVMGIPIYGRTHPGKKTVPVKNLHRYNSYTKKWDDQTKVPYLANRDGSVFLSYENEKSVEIKCQYIVQKELLGAMYWEYTSDGPKHPLLKTIKKKLK